MKIWRPILALCTLSMLQAAIGQSVPAPHPLVELRGVWLVSNDLSKPRDELKKMLNAFASANFNTVFIDVWFRGYVAYPDSKIAPQFPALRGHDVIGFLVDECHKRNLQAHLWVSYGFYAYFTPDASRDTSTGPLLDANPKLAAIDSLGNRFLHHK